MTSQQILQVLLLGFWAPLISLAFFYIFWRRLEGRRRERTDHEMQMMYQDQRHRTEYEIERLQDELRNRTAFLEKAIDAKMEDLGTRIRQTVESTIEIVRSESHIARLSAVKNGGVSLSDAGAETETEHPNENAQLIREISHALNTPLSHIEAGLLVLDSQAIKGQQTELQERLGSIFTGIEACKAIIAGFRESILSSRSTTTWSQPSLQQAIEHAALMDISVAKRDMEIDVQLPDIVEGFSNNYLVALLLPIVENAVESGKSGSTLSISSRKDDEYLYLDITSDPSVLPVSNQIYADGFTTKSGHSGTGLSIVKRLLSGRGRATLTHTIRDQKVTFTIMLPLPS